MGLVGCHARGADILAIRGNRLADRIQGRLAVRGGPVSAFLLARSASEKTMLAGRATSALAALAMRVASVLPLFHASTLVLFFFCLGAAIHTSFAP